MEQDMCYLENAEEYSNDKLEKLKENFEIYRDDPVCAVVVGSFARREATNQSDLDYFVITDDKECGDKVLSQFPDFLKSHDIKAPSDGGAFGGTTKVGQMLNNVGGKDGDNDSLTRRLLFLLESECLVGEDMYNRIQDELIKIYVKDGITEHQICRFLLNDLIRYYRTICVDFEYKTSEQSKSWGDRNIKLLFSRKLMFFSGLLTVAQTAQSTCIQKREVLKRYFNLTPIQRVREICGDHALTALGYYSDFINCIGCADTRAVLNRTHMERDTHDEEFRVHKNKGHHFTWCLSRLLDDTFDANHPIHLALKF